MLSNELNRSMGNLSQAAEPTVKYSANKWFSQPRFTYVSAPILKSMSGVSVALTLAEGEQRALRQKIIHF